MSTDDDCPDQYDQNLLPPGGRWTCCGWPVQAEGRLRDGRAWYFRERHGEWRFDVMKVPNVPHDHTSWDVWTTVARGDCIWDGDMPAEVAAGLIHAYATLADAQSDYAQQQVDAARAHGERHNIREERYQTGPGTWVDLTVCEQYCGNCDSWDTVEGVTGALKWMATHGMADCPVVQATTADPPADLGTTADPDENPRKDRT